MFKGLHIKMFNLFILLQALLHLERSAADRVPQKSVNVLKPRQKVIIIADPGVDDAAAILMAVAHPAVDVLAVISNFGIHMYH